MGIVLMRIIMTTIVDRIFLKYWLRIWFMVVWTGVKADFKLRRLEIIKAAVEIQMKSIQCVVQES